LRPADRGPAASVESDGEAGPIATVMAWHRRLLLW